jgi:hypothetical protein
MINDVKNALLSILKDLDEQRIASEKTYKTTIEFDTNEVYKVWRNRVRKIEEKYSISLGFSDKELKDALKPHIKTVFHTPNIQNLLDKPEAFGKNTGSQYNLRKQGRSLFVELVKGAYYQKKREIKKGVVKDSFVGTQKVINYVMQELYYQMGDLIQNDNTFAKIHQTNSSGEKTASALLESSAGKGAIVGHGKLGGSKGRFQSTIASEAMAENVDSTMEGASANLQSNYFPEITDGRFAPKAAKELAKSANVITDTFATELEREYHFSQHKDHDTKGISNQYEVEAHYTDRKGNKALDHFDKTGITKKIKEIETNLRKTLLTGLKKDSDKYIKLKGSNSVLDAAVELTPHLIIQSMFPHKTNPDMRYKVNKRLAQNAKTATTNSSQSTSVKRKGQNKKTTTRRRRGSKIGAVAGFKGAQSHVEKKAGSNPMALRNLLNEMLPQIVSKNMIAPALQFRTGRFANSVRVDNVTQGPRGGNTMIEASYMTDPYSTFAPGGKKYTPQRNPEALIKRSVREIATSIVGARFGVTVD